jgi:hypothetical protein
MYANILNTKIYAVLITPPIQLLMEFSTDIQTLFSVKDKIILVTVFNP